MSVRTWIGRQRDRPIADHDRHTAMAAVVVLLAAVAALLTLNQPTSKPSHAWHPPSRDWQAAPNTTGRLDMSALTPEAQRVARRFLAGYLAYTYGHASASKIADTTLSLIRSLQARPPRVPPAARERYPRVIALQPASASAGRLGVRATVNDGGLIDYSVDLALASQDGRPVVVALDGAR